MAAITDAEWGRIYAFIWKKYQEGDHSYKEDFEKDPKMAIDTKIGPEITPPLKGTEILDIGDKPSDISDADLQEIIEGKRVAFLHARLTC